MINLSPLAGAIDTLRAEWAASGRAPDSKFLDVSFEEHFTYQTAQAHAHASGLISAETANIIYRALGETGAPKNGGWAARADTATKYVVTLAMERILSDRLAARES